MPRTGRPPKPIELKRKLGNPGGRPLPRSGITALVPVIRMDPVPTFPNGMAWVQAILDSGASSWVGETDRLGLLEFLADAYDERRTLRAAMFSMDVPDDMDRKTLRAWGEATRRELRDLEKQITAWLSLLGLSPTDRSRLGVAEVKARSKLEEIADRRAGRRGS